ncbi:potassium channel protein [Campylobacter insulaenigrae]|uniref:Potassium channel protein n=2 Tax=Campylobacter insulaenigrae TaxID=260714 RepID=A0ABY3G3C8_9BACT|nr:potassium channel protein [Campylobacter insulaenigrae]AJC87956.1 putative potassium channel protein (TrkA domain) [Campylobacter insulaenigrae NCTC 12927]MCR6570261.1 potassium channel protein [Campylobacter insulaenigrae]MCR6571663.1 potassium channel protein [Campylobacter insulaenigrae]MCR6573301.1 potassium channel protein [Campylobacter insulaenigrae]MCR6574766.1 potassium channel protein [Campylobacter insulaenigrae]
MSFLKKLKKFLNWSSSPKPAISLNDELYGQLKFLRIPLIAIVIITLIGAFGYMLTSNFNLNDAIYQAGMTFTTLGYTEVNPISTAGRIFTVLYVLSTFTIFTFCMGLVIEIIKKGTLLKIIKERRMLHKVARLKNHFVICYHNDFTIELAQQFRENHIPFVVVDEIQNFDEISEKYRYPYYIEAAPHTNLAFLKSNLSSAKGVITLSHNIADNIAIIASVRLFEKELQRINPYFILASSANDDETQKLKKLGANSIVSATKLVAQRLSAMSARPDMENLLENYLYKKNSPIDLEEVKIPDESWVRFKRLKEIHLRDMANVSVVGILENKKFTPMPKGDTLIGTGSKLLLVGTADSIKIAKKIIKNKQKPDELKYI